MCRILQVLQSCLSNSCLIDGYAVTVMVTGALSSTNYIALINASPQFSAQEQHGVHFSTSSYSRSLLTSVSFLPAPIRLPHIIDIGEGKGGGKLVEIKTRDVEQCLKKHKKRPYSCE